MTKSLLAIFAVTALTGSSLFGQDELRVTIPFDFNAGQHALAAGDYTVRMSYAAGTIQVRTADARHAVQLLAHAASPSRGSDTARLVFHKYGDRYFLSQVFQSGNNPGQELPRSHEEQEQIAARHAVKTITIAAMVR
ncbi:MAG: hypothetical protein JO307_10305 [Bryobacterales bacterium]|nr:hypothetical protein [Bryobacterales bacterium]MBV9397842.1 hypothetical protein [Bryobacterales bacterium]